MGETDDTIPQHAIRHRHKDPLLGTLHAQQFDLPTPLLNLSGKPGGELNRELGLRFHTVEKGVAVDA